MKDDKFDQVWSSPTKQLEAISFIWQDIMKIWTSKKKFLNVLNNLSSYLFLVGYLDIDAYLNTLSL